MGVCRGMGMSADVCLSVGLSVRCLSDVRCQMSDVRYQMSDVRCLSVCLSDRCLSVCLSVGLSDVCLWMSADGREAFGVQRSNQRLHLALAGVP